MEIELNRYDLEKFRNGLLQLNMNLSDNQICQFLVYYEKLMEKNKVMNLTAITEFDDVVEKHFLDSLSIVKFFDFSGEKKILDLGTGAGFPGIPLKIAFPDLKMVLMDSLNKRILFLQDLIYELGLKNITAVHGRAEEMARKNDYREKFDVCVSRAVANLSSLSEYCIPFVQMGGYFISYKSGKVEEEIRNAEKAIRLFGGKKKLVQKFQIPGTEMNRSFIMIEKISKTPKTYPRKAGTPERNPLI